MIFRLLLFAVMAEFTLYAAPLRVLILTGSSDEPYHHWRETTRCLREAMDQTGRFDVRINEEPRSLTPESLKGYDAVVLNYNGPRFPAATETALESFIRSGGGFIAFHQASYGTFYGQEFRNGKWHAGKPGEGWQAFPKIIGATWDPEKLGHARRCVFTVNWKDASHPITRGFPSSFVANDELYHRLTLFPATQVLADALSPADLGGTGQREPLIWTNQFGQGRVFFTVMGHDPMAWYQPGMLNSFLRGVEWAATGQVTLPVPEPHQTGKSKNAIRLLAVTGGHGYPSAFYGMLDSLQNVNWTHAATAEEAFANPLENIYDVVLLHDMHAETSPQTRARLKAFVEAGKGIISLHHSIVDYTDWPWWYEEVTGGKYFVEPSGGHPASQYKEDLEYLVQPVPSKENHPVLQGVGPLWVYDELYRGMWISPKVEVLMETDSPDNDKPVVYIGPHPKARVLYIQLGHSDHTMKHPGFRRLLQNAVVWTARRN
jgi:type 1 glutamine amidotransferase